MSFTNWNDQVVNLLTEIRNNGTPEGGSTGAVNLKVGDVPVSDLNPVPISDAGGSITVDGTVNLGNLPETQTVDGSVEISNFPETQTVDGSVEISNFPETQTVDGSVEISNFPETQTVDGTVNISNLPNQPYANYSNLGSVNAASVKAAPGSLYALSCYNAKDCKRYLQLFNKASAPETGDTPVESYPIGAECLLVLDSAYFGSLGRQFNLGIAWGFSMSLASFAPAIASDQSTHIKYL